MTYCLIHEVEDVLELLNYITHWISNGEDRLRIQRATGTDIELLFDELSEPRAPIWILNSVFLYRSDRGDPPQDNT